MPPSRRMSAATAKVVKTMSLFGSIEMLGLLCSAVRVKAVALWLGPAGVGLFTLYYSAMTLVSTGTQLSLRTSAVRTVAAGRGDSPAACRRAAVTLWSIVLASLGALAMALGAPLLSLAAFGSLSHAWGYASLALAVALMALTSGRQALLQGGGHLKALATASARGVLAALALSLPLLWWLRMDGILPVLTVYALAACWAAWRAVPGIGGVLPPLAGWGPLLRQGWPMVRLGAFMTLASLFAEGAAYALTAWLNDTGGEGTVGVYQAGYTLAARYVGLVFTAIGMEYWPRLAGVGGSMHRMQVFVAHEAGVVLKVLLPVLLVLVPLVPLAVRLLYSADFLAATPYILCALPGTVLRGYAWCVAFTVLARGDGRIYMFTEGLSALLMIVLSVGGYRLWGMAGMGVAYTLWYGAYALIVTGVYRRRYGGRIPPRILLLLALVTAAVTATCCCMYSLNHPEI